MKNFLEIQLDEKVMSINIDHIMYITNEKSYVTIMLSDSSEITLLVFDKYKGKETEKGATSLKSSIDNALNSSSGNKIKKVDFSSKYLIKSRMLSPVIEGEFPVGKA